MNTRYEFRNIHPWEYKEAAQVEKICFPPSEACTEPIMEQRAKLFSDTFIVAIEKESGKMVGFVNGMLTEEEVLRDEIFLDIRLHNPSGRNVMIMGVDVLPEYRGQGLAKEMMRRFVEVQKAAGRKKCILTCVEEKIPMYQKMGYTDDGPSESSWGGEFWHEMHCDLM